MFTESLYDLYDVFLVSGNNKDLCYNHSYTNNEL